MVVLPEDIARIAHEVNRGFCRALDDYSHKEWEDAPQWQKDSALNGVMEHLRNPHMTPEDSHNAWLEQKQEEGWVYGPVRDEKRRTHPNMVPYDQLMRVERAKDYLFKAVVDAMRKQVTWPRGS